MKESEKDLERALYREVGTLGGWCFKLLPFLVRGLPDRICLLPGGRVAFAEIKTTGDTPSKLQLKVRARLRELGFMAEVLDSSEAITNFVTKFNK